MLRRANCATATGQLPIVRLQVLRVYAELQNKQRAVYGDDEAAREAAGKATHPRGISQPREAGGCLRATPQHADRC